jgi:uncharacterized protein with HEPN domain
MKKDPLVYIDDIRDSIEAIKRYTTGLTKADFFSSSEKQDAVYRRLEVIGEAANRLPDEFRNQYPMIPWHQIVGVKRLTALLYGRYRECQEHVTTHTGGVLDGSC